MDVTFASIRLVRSEVFRIFHRKEVSCVLRLKINLRVRRSVRVKCPRHPRYNPECEGAGAIRGGCRYCLAMYELRVCRLTVQSSLPSWELGAANRTLRTVRCGSR